MQLIKNKIIDNYCTHNEYSACTSVDVLNSHKNRHRVWYIELFVTIVRHNSCLKKKTHVFAVYLMRFCLHWKKKVYKNLFV